MLNVLKSLFAKEPYDLSGNDFKQKFQSTKNAVLLDVRTPGEFSSGSIRGARNINCLAPDFVDRMRALPKDSVYFLYCRSGARSGNACATLRNMGFEVYNLSGGIGAWPK